MPAGSVTYTSARPADRPVLFRMLLGARLNFLAPLTTPAGSIVVARDASSGVPIGGAKLGRMDATTYQLSSVVVDKPWRGQGVGKNLIRRALELAPADATVFLTTLEDRQALYKPFAFEVCDPTRDQVPASLKLEMAIGAALFSAANLIVMRRN